MLGEDLEMTILAHQWNQCSYTVTLSEKKIEFLIHQKFNKLITVLVEKNLIVPAEKFVK